MSTAASSHGFAYEQALVDAIAPETPSGRKGWKSLLLEQLAFGEAEARSTLRSPPANLPPPRSGDSPWRSPLCFRGASTSDAPPGSSGSPRAAGGVARRSGHVQHRCDCVGRSSKAAEASRARPPHERRRCGPLARADPIDRQHLLGQGAVWLCASGWFTSTRTPRPATFCSDGAGGCRWLVGRGSKVQHCLVDNAERHHLLAVAKSTDQERL